MFEHLITAYGYFALLIGTFLEGETILVIGGFLAHRGYLELPWVILSALFGTFAGDQFFFYLGRYKGTAYLKRRPRWQDNTERVFELLERHPLLIVIGFRFLYGLRTVTPFVIGCSRLPAGRFFLLNFFGAACWSVLVGCSGYYFGQALELLLMDIKRFEVAVVVLIASVGAFTWFFWRRGRRSK